jgi:hypothetical protein
MYEIEKYGIGVVYNGIMSVLNFMKIGQLVQKLKMGLTQQHGGLFMDGK